jgi:phage I-like protein
MYFCLCKADVSAEASWFHTLPPPGEYPADGVVLHKGKPVKGAVFVIDQAAYDTIIAKFRADAGRPDWPGVLVDREHCSLRRDQPSDAMAWAKDIRVDESGLWTRWDLTPPGKVAWDSKVLVSRSPVMDLEPLGNSRFRPVSLESIAMTNTPHFDMLSTLAAARAAEEQTQQGDQPMKKLLALLGLPETATEDEAASALQAMIDKAAKADTAVAAQKTAETACRKARCDAFIVAHKAQIADEAKFRTAYEANPEATEAAFGVFKSAPEKPQGQTRIIAKEAKTPDGKGADVALAAERRTQQSAAVAACRASNPGMTCREAEAVCRRQQPALFTTSAE